MRRGLTLLAVAVILLGVSYQAEATAISLNPSLAACASPAVPACLALSGPETSNSAITTIIDNLLGVDEIYKANPGAGLDEGTAASWYTSSISDSGGTITWNGGNYIGGSPIYFLVKDGNHNPAWYLYDISNWGGKDTITFSNFWPAQGGISHVAIFGGFGVPDGGSVVMLLGAALMGLAGLRRLMK